jgi:MHS family citrate/tricarballylate:H+ symporter-like MFS transporter
LPATAGQRSASVSISNTVRAAGALTDIIPVQIRTTGFSLAYSLATALFGGMTPLLSTWLIQTTGAISLLATFLIYRGIVKEHKVA